MAAGGADRDSALKAMAENRGCRLVRSRRRTPGAGDYGRYGLKDKASGEEVLGFGPGGLTATADEVEAWLRGGLVSTWKKSVAEAPARKVEAKPKRQARGPAGPAPPPSPPPPPPPKPALTVREAMPRDSDAIAALVSELGFPATRAEIARRLPALRKAGEPPLVAEDGAEEGEVIGCLAWHVTPALHRPHPVGRVTMMVVTKKARGRGVGKALLEAAEARLRAAGCGLIEVTSNIELGGAHEFYRRRGFERTSYRFAKKLG